MICLQADGTAVTFTLFLIATNLSCLESVPEILDESQVVNTYSKLASFLYITHILKGES